MITNSSKKILVVDDDIDILELIRFNLESVGYQVVTATDGSEVIGILNDESIDLAILDIGLPGMTGIEICRRMRQDERLGDVPIIFVTARTQETDLLIGFQVGANDYIKKPFSPRELLARVQSQFRGKNTQDSVYHHKTFEIFFDRHLVKIESNRINLTQREFGVIKTLIQSNGRTVSRNHLLEVVWGMDAHSGQRSVDIVITRLREKIKPYHTCIRTITGVGYQWDVSLD